MNTEKLYLYDKSVGGIIAGVDEAGRGPLAGPVICAACIMGDCYIEGIDDSKKLSEKKREYLYDNITNNCRAYAVGIIDEKTVDELNIYQATKIGMEKAVKSLSIMPDIVLIDAMKLDIEQSQLSLVKGDATSYAIAAASIIAKVTRDRMMREYDAMYPEYGFAKHKGYGTAEHIAALKKYGPCPIHRRTFIKNFFNE